MFPRVPSTVDRSIASAVESGLIRGAVIGFTDLGFLTVSTITWLVFPVRIFPPLCMATIVGFFTLLSLVGVAFWNCIVFAFQLR